MVHFQDQQALVLDGLRDAGCDASLCQAVLQYLNAAQEEHVEHALCLLRQHKRTLLSQLHEDEHKIDVVDFLIYHIQQGHREEKG